MLLFDVCCVLFEVCLLLNVVCYWSLLGGRCCFLSRFVAVVFNVVVGCLVLFVCSWLLFVCVGGCCWLLLFDVVCSC